MRKPIEKPIYPERCLTNWGAVLDVSKRIVVYGRMDTGGVYVHDPKAIDPAGQYLDIDNIQLIWRVKRRRL